MINLLRANFARLFRFRPLWICVILSIAVSFINDITFAITMNKDWIYKTGDLIINQVGTIAMFLAAIFASLYLGTEYAHGTIRNKLASGHSRAGTYFANLIPVTTGSLIIYAAYCAPLVVMSLIWGKDLGMEVGDFCMQILIIVLCGNCNKLDFHASGYTYYIKIYRNYRNIGSDVCDVSGFNDIVTEKAKIYFG